MTHYMHDHSNVKPDGTVMAVCGALVDERLFSSDPGCPACVTWLADEAAMLDRLTRWSNTVDAEQAAIRARR